MAEVVVNNSYYNNKLNNLIDEFYSLDYDNMDYTTISGDFCLLYTSPSPRDQVVSRMPSSA